MGKHDAKIKRLIVERMLKGTAGEIISETVLSYTDEFPLNDLDLVYRKWVVTQLNALAEGLVFIGTFVNLAELEGVPPAEIPEGAYAFVGTTPNFGVYYWDKLSEVWYASPILLADILDALNGANSPSGANPFATIADIVASGSLPQNIIDALNQALNPSASNPFVTRDDLPESINTPQILSFDLVINSDVSGTLNASWTNDVFETKSVTNQALVFLGTPSAGNYRWDLIKLNYDGTVSVINGVEGATPVRPSEGVDGIIGADIIWNDLGEFIIEEPEITFPNDRFKTAIKSNNSGNFAKVLEGAIAKGQMYSISLVYTNFSSDWVNQGKGDTGVLNVTFLTNNQNDIIPTSVKIETVAGNSEVGDWILVDNAGLFQLWHKSKAFWGRAQFRVLFINDVVNKDWFIQNAPYVVSIPNNDAQFNSIPYNNYTDYEADTGNVKFSLLNGKPRKYGFTTPLTGNIIFDPVGAIETTMIKIRHNHNVAPSFSVAGGGVDLIFEGGSYEISQNNYIYAIAHKNNAGVLTAISYTINQNTV